MAGLDEQAQWETEIYQIEQTDPVVGGPPNLVQGQGITNVPHQALANRTAWLKAQVDGLVAAGYVTQADIDGAIRALVDGAPDTLDTLKKIATALGDTDDSIGAILATLADKLGKSATAADSHKLGGKGPEHYSWGGSLPHTKFKSFNEFLGTDLFGTHFVHNEGGDGPPHDSSQYYHMRLGLGEERTTASLQIAIPRNHEYLDPENVHNTLYFRREERGIVKAWQKIEGFTRASAAEAEAGEDNTHLMTPLRTKQAITAAIDVLVDGAPEALDTLNELAAALGDDPNFAATLTAELNKLKTPVVAAIADDAALDGVNATSVWTAAQGTLTPPLAIGGTIEHTELSDGSAMQKAYRITPAGVFLTKHIRTRRIGVWSDWTADGPDIGDLVIQTHSGTLLDRLEANGAVRNRSSYADLFWRIGTSYGAGDGATTFGTPDMRGEFLRGWDNGRGVDAGRGLGSHQGDAIRNITGKVGTRGVSSHGSHDAEDIFEGAFTRSSQISTMDRASYQSRTSSYPIVFNATRVVPTADENRPRNIAQMFCITF